MVNPTFTFPFGRPVRACKPSASGSRPVFVLGAYPSALHVQWTPPQGYKRIRAIAVDNEPEPFWNGEGEEERIERWKRAVKFDPAVMGEVRTAGSLNGRSGRWVEENVLEPLGVGKGDAWITDALDTYRCSAALAARLLDTYDEFAMRAGLPGARLPRHPDEKQIILESLEKHTRRLMAELEACRPDRIVTLGNAALAVMLELSPRVAGAELRRLSAEAGYGRPTTLRLGTRRVELLPLAHPAAPRRYQTAHEAWKAATRRRRARA
jgi:uracil-DNA glycosylase